MYSKYIGLMESILEVQIRIRGLYAKKTKDMKLGRSRSMK